MFPGQSCQHSKLLLQHDDDERLLCGPRQDDMREYDTGRSAITVVMETDDVVTSGGFWLKYECKRDGWLDASLIQCVQKLCVHNS